MLDQMLISCYIKSFDTGFCVYLANNKILMDFLNEVTLKKILPEDKYNKNQ